MAKEDTTAEAVNDDALSDDEALTAAEEEYFESGGTKGELVEQDDEEPEKAETKSEDKTEDAKDEKSADSEADDNTETKSEDAGTEGDGKQKTVPHGALHAEREEHKQTKAALSQMQQNQAMLQGRIEQMAQLIQPQQEQEGEAFGPPDPEDILGNVNWLIQRAVEDDQNRKQAEELQKQQQQIANAQQNMRDSIMGKLNPAMENDPTLAAARDHVKASLITEAKMQGATDQQALGYVQQIEMQNMALIHRNNLDPAEYLKQFATNRGWTPKTNNDSGEDEGAKTAEQIAAQAKAADKHKSLSSAAGGSVASGEDIANMSDEEFSEWYEKQGDKGFQKATAA